MAWGHSEKPLTSAGWCLLPGNASQGLRSPTIKEQPQVYHNTYARTHTHTRTYTHTRTHQHRDIHPSIYLSMYVRIYMCACIHKVYIHTLTHARTDTHTHLHTPTHTHTQAYIHTHIHSHIHVYICGENKGFPTLGHMPSTGHLVQRCLASLLHARPTDARQPPPHPGFPANFRPIRVRRWHPLSLRMRTGREPHHFHPSVKIIVSSKLTLSLSARYNSVLLGHSAEFAFRSLNSSSHNLKVVIWHLCETNI